MTWPGFCGDLVASGPEELSRADLLALDIPVSRVVETAERTRVTSY